ncbi:hypothetical protein EIP86_010235 [Pleurotus ostreatoroseus]|nr:hypothetical protein EIP86_010235 [Pleurotus ostreatoroseus]
MAHRKPAVEKQASAEGSKKKRGSKRKRKVAASDLDDLRSQRDRVKESRLAPNTNTAYAGHIKRGLEFIKEVADRRADVVFNEADGQPSVQAEVDAGEAINYAELAVAFDYPPNRLSPYALELFLTEKCIQQGCGQSLAEQVHAAFKDHWRRMGDGRYRGRWSCDPETGRVSGNPADSPEVEDIMQSIKNTIHAAGAPRDHAEAMKIEDLRKMMNWSLQECPQALVDTVLAQEAKGETCSVETRLFITKHLQIRGFYSSSFVLWTRNQELCQLQGQHYMLDCEGEEPYNMPYDRIRLAHRKGWTRKNGNPMQVIGRNYRIFNNLKTPSEINMHFHLRQWRTWLETVLLRRPLQPQDYIFPTVSVNGQVQIKTHLTNIAVQDWLRETCAAVKLTVVYTTHSFRRGGAQYRFMWCPIGQRWSLSAVRWWGGWADGEHSDTLIKYLIDELNEYESSFENQLCPLHTEAKESFMGDHLKVSAVSAEEVQEAALAMKRQAEAMMTAIQPFIAALTSNGIMIPMPVAHQTTVNPFNTLSGPATEPQATVVEPPSPMSTSQTAGSNVSFSLEDPAFQVVAPNVTAPAPSDCASVNTGPWSPHSPSDPLTVPPQAIPSGAAPSVPVVIGPPFPPPAWPFNAPIPWHMLPPQRPPWFGHPSLQPPQMPPPFATPFVQHPTTAAHAILNVQGNIGGKQNTRKVQPIEKAVIPNLRRGPRAWRQAVDQWDQVDPDTNYALKDWPKEWYTGEMGTYTGAKYDQRRMVALEFIDKYDRDEDVFLEEYPEANNGFAQLVDAIRRKQIARNERVARPGRRS